MIAVLVPVLNRPFRVAPFATSYLNAVSKDFDSCLYFIANESDRDEIVMIEELGDAVQLLTVPWEPGRGDWARKLNFAIREVESEYYLLGADDLHFHTDWIDTFMWWDFILAGHGVETGVLGTNDLGNPLVIAGKHSTHPIVHRSYIEQGTIDDPTKLLHEGYWHNWVDNEFVETATTRDQFFFIKDCFVEHLHHAWGKSSEDSTYARGQEHYQEDALLFKERAKLWGGPLPR